MGYLPLGREVCDNILLNYSSSDPLVNVGRLALASTLFLSYPLLILPCRQTVARLVLLAMAPAARARGSGDVDESAPLLEPSSPRVEVVAIPARPDAGGGGLGPGGPYGVPHRAERVPGGVGRPTRDDH